MNKYTILNPLNVIPGKLTREKCDILEPILLDNCNKNNFSQTFPGEQKLADITKQPQKR